MTPGDLVVITGITEERHSRDTIAWRSGELNGTGLNDFVMVEKGLTGVLLELFSNPHRQTKARVLLADGRALWFLLDAVAAA